MTNTIHHLQNRVRRADRWNDIQAYILAASIGVNLFQFFG